MASTRRMVHTVDTDDNGEAVKRWVLLTFPFFAKGKKEGVWVLIGLRDVD